MSSISVTPLGQSGFLFGHKTCKLLIDPYLSDYVEEVEGEQSRRLSRPSLDPQKLDDVDWVLLTHAHIDHCDPKTVLPVSEASPGCQFIGSWEVVNNLKTWGIHTDRLIVADGEWVKLSESAKVRSVIAAHPEVERNSRGLLRCVGFVFDFDGKRIYHSGDTSLVSELLEELQDLGAIEVAFVSINERNYFRDSAGIIGNMSVRDAFGLAEAIGVNKFVPMHWDMFAANRVYREEFELLYEKTQPNFEMLVNPSVV